MQKNIRKNNYLLLFHLLVSSELEIQSVIIKPRLQMKKWLSLLNPIVIFSRQHH